MIDDEQIGLLSDQEAVVFGHIGGIHVVAFSDLSLRHREADDLVVGGKVELFLSRIEIVIILKLEQGILLNGDLLFFKDQVIGLIEGKLGFWNLQHFYLIFLIFDNMIVAGLLETSWSREVTQPGIIISINDDDSVEKGKHFESRYVVLGLCTESRYIEVVTVSDHVEDRHYFLVPTDVETTILLRMS